MQPNKLMDFEKEYEHYGVAISITNKNKDKFFLQKKDGGCPIPEFRNRYCFFGGKVEKGESEFEALKRELKEEIEKEAAEIIIKNAKKLFTDYFLNVLNKKTKFSIYESVLSDEELSTLSRVKINEGTGELIEMKNVLTIPFLGDLKKTLRIYLKF